MVQDKPHIAVPVTVIDKIEEHPNADRLELASVDGITCVVQKGTFKAGDAAIYIPEDALVPVDRPYLRFLDKKGTGKPVRIKAQKLRGIFSVGVLIPVPADWDSVVLGQDVSRLLGIIKYEEPIPAQLWGERAHVSALAVPRYKLEPYKKYSRRVLVPGEEVQVTEKIHGTNCRVFWADEQLQVGSRNLFLKESDTNVYWRAVRAIPGIAECLEDDTEDLVLFGEVYGDVQDLKYDIARGQVVLTVFDAYSCIRREWFSVDQLDDLCATYAIPQVPQLYRGPYVPEIVEPLAEGRSTIASHIREGIVVRPIHDRWHPRCGRVALKLKGEAYQLRRNGTEYH